MLLAADIGNTNITLGVFDGEKLIKTFRLETNAKEYEVALSSVLEGFNIDSCAIVSVVQAVSSEFKTACDNLWKINSRLFSSYKDFDIEIAVKNPQTVGADRLANAFAAISAYKLPAIVIDVGTAITFDVVSRDKKFLGGVIMPGVGLQLKALNQYTSKLPLVEIKKTVSAIGDCTENAILSGVIKGTASAIEGLVAQCEKELGESATVVITGGQGEMVAEYFSHLAGDSSPNLTLYGLRDLYFVKHVNLY